MDLHLNEPGSLAWLQFLQVTVLIAVVGLLAGLFCRRRPHLAYVLWILVLLKCLTPPLEQPGRHFQLGASPLHTAGQFNG